MENRPPNITYLLGAGASAGAIPVVTKFKEGLFELADSFIRHNSDDLIAQKINEDFLWLANLHDIYYSIDTAAKVFYHREGPNSESLKRLKQTILIYFLLEQLPSKEMELERLPSNRAPVDNRYFRLLAYFLGDTALFFLLILIS